MYFYGRTSRERRDTCHPDAICIMNEIIKYFNASVLCGLRSLLNQQLAFLTEKSKVQWPDSMHNVDPDNPRCSKYPDRSMAFDIAEYHRDIVGYIDWDNKQEMWDNAKIILLIARDLKQRGLITYDLRWGGDWNGNGIPVFLDEEETFWDAVHFELVGVK